MSKKEVRFQMPRIELGDTVLWHPEASSILEPRPALVVYVGQDTIAVAVLEKDSFGVVPLDGVRFESDPALGTPEARGSGSWSYTPMALRIQGLEKQWAEAFGSDKQKV